MPVTIERHETHSLIRLEGEVTITSAAELKEALLAGLAAGTDLHLDLERAETHRCHGHAVVVGRRTGSGSHRGRIGRPHVGGGCRDGPGGRF